MALIIFSVFQFAWEANNNISLRSSASSSVILMIWRHAVGAASLTHNSSKRLLLLIFISLLRATFVSFALLYKRRRQSWEAVKRWIMCAYLKIALVSYITNEYLRALVAVHGLHLGIIIARTIQSTQYKQTQTEIRIHARVGIFFLWKPHILSGSKQRHKNEIFYILRHLAITNRIFVIVAVGCLLFSDRFRQRLSHCCWSNLHSVCGVVVRCLLFVQ